MTELTKRLAWVAWLLCLVSAAMSLGAIGFLVVDGYHFWDALNELPSIEIALAFPVVGALITARHPGNPIGWILCVAGITQVTVEFTYLYAHHVYEIDPGSLPGADIAAWFSIWTWMPGFGLLLTFLPLLFPTGSLLSPRWRPIAWLSGLCLGAMTLVTATSQWHHRGPGLLADLEEELPWFSTLFFLLLICGLASAVSLVLRFRRSRGEERQQLKWLTFGLAALVALFFLDSLLPRGRGELLNVAALVIIPCVPAAIGIAILRYRLYDIDVVINRTLVYGSLTAILAGSYLVIVVALQQILSGVTKDSDVAIAGSTLMVAALFQPVRTRLQSFIDRRFYRQKYDAAETLGHFSARLREEVDLDSLHRELVTVVTETMQPTHASLWLRKTS